MCALFILGISVLLILSGTGVIIASHFIKQIISKQSGIDLKGQPTSQRRRIVLFRFGCTTLIIAGATELIFLIPRYFLIIDDDMSTEHLIAQTCVRLTVDVLHGFNFGMIIIIFIFRLKIALNGLVFDYPQQMYNSLLFITITLSILGVICASLRRVNEIYQILNNTVEENKWYLNPITFGITTSIVFFSLTIYLIFQVLLVFLLANALLKVCD